jgi:hypothetical protein
MLTAQSIPRKVVYLSKAAKARAALAPYVTRPGRQMAEVASLGPAPILRRAVSC